MKNELSKNKQPCTIHSVMNSEAAVCPKCGNTNATYLDGKRLIVCDECCWIGQSGS